MEQRGSGTALRGADVFAPGREQLGVAAGRAGLRLRPLATTAWAASVLALLLFRLGAAPLFDVDEGAFAEATREMLASRDFGATTLDGAPRFDKPILVYWLQAASVAALGAGEGAVRLPSALCAFGWAVLLTLFVSRRWGRRAGLLAGTVLVTSAGPLVIGRAATADALLNLLLAAALLDAWRWIEAPRPAPLRRVYLWVGLGLLAKGPVAPLIVAAVTFLFLASRREPGRWLRAAGDGPGWAILLAVAGPWYAYALHRHGSAFVDGFLVRHNLARYTGVLEGHGGSVGYYLLLLPVLLLPWAALLPSVLRAVPTQWRHAGLERYLVIWAGFVVVFFSFSGTKLPHYALYGATPVFILLALAAERGGPRARSAVAVAVAVLLAVLAVAPGLVPAVAPRVKDPLYAALLGGAGEGAAALQVAASLGLLLWLLAALRLGPRPGVLAGGAAGLALIIVGAGVPWLSGALQGPIVRAAEVARGRSERVVQYRVRVPSFSFYRGAPTPRAAPAPGELALTTDRALASFPGTYEVVHRERGYALVRVPEAHPPATGSAASGP